MGNQPGSHSKGGVVIEETLESMQKEKQRDDHLKNLEFKRSKSIRKSIAKRLKGGKKRKDQKSKDQLDAPPSSGASDIGDTSNSLNGRLTSDVVSTQPAATKQPTIDVEDSSFWKDLFESDLLVGAMTSLAGLVVLIGGIAYCTKKYRAKRKEKLNKKTGMPTINVDEDFDDFSFNVAYGKSPHKRIGKARDASSPSLAELGQFKTRGKISDSQKKKQKQKEKKEKRRKLKSGESLGDSDGMYGDSPEVKAARELVTGETDNTFFFDNPMLNPSGDMTLNSTTADGGAVFKVAKIVTAQERLAQQRLQDAYIADKNRSAERDQLARALAAKFDADYSDGGSGRGSGGSGSRAHRPGGPGEHSSFPCIRSAPSATKRP
jgi:hypothetical protein